MKTGLLIIAAVFTTNVRVDCADWHLTALDEYQDAMRACDNREEILLCQKEPKLHEFYMLWHAVREVVWRMERRAMVLKLEAAPPDGGIVWQNPWVWGSPIKTTEEEQALAARDPVFSDIRKEKLRLAEEVHLRLYDLGKLRNSVHQSLKSEDAASYELLKAALVEIQKNVQADQRPQGTPGNEPSR
jgi:hypothetical protein